MKNLMNFDGSEFLAARLSDWDPFSGSIKVKKNDDIFQMQFFLSIIGNEKSGKKRENYKGIRESIKKIEWNSPLIKVKISFWICHPNVKACCPSQNWH